MARNKKRYLFEYNMFYVNILSIVLLIIPLLVTVVIDYNYKLNLFKMMLDTFNNPMFSIILFASLIIWFVLHEVIHGITYRLTGAKKGSISYGAALEKGVFYCKCSQFVNKKCILLSVIAPFLIIGVFTYVIGAVTGSGLLLILSIFNISGAAGDIAMFCFFLGRKKDVKFMELDDTLTFCLETTEDMVAKKFLAVTLKKVVANPTELKETKKKIITVSKGSYIVIGIVIVLLLVSVMTMFL